MATTSMVITTTVSIQNLRPTYAYRGSLPTPPVQVNYSGILFRVALPAWMPKNTVIASAVVKFAQYRAWSGTNTLTVQRNAAAFSSATTWAKRPALTDTPHPVTQTATPDGTWWAFDVTADLQGFLAGTKANYGWRLSTSATKRYVNAATAKALKPVLEIVYNIPGLAPSGLVPDGGAVSVPKPVLTFNADDDDTAIQVQVDPAFNATTPAFDSGEVPATAGVLDLAATSYAGLANGATTYWRARQKDALGWSDWSLWATFSRQDLPVITLLSPVAAPADTTPPFEWSVAGSCNAWQARLLDAFGGVLSDSGKVAGNGTTWTPAKGFKALGDQGTAELRIYDGVVRAATPGAPTYALVTRALTVTLDNTVPPLDTFAVGQVYPYPVVHLVGTRAGGTPDEVVIFRNEVQVARIPGTDAFDGVNFAYDDWTAPMNLPARYRVAPVVNGKVAGSGPTVEVVPRCTGLWLVDDNANLAAVLWGQDDGDFVHDEVATVSQPIGPGQPVVRRRLNRPPVSGSVAGQVIDAMGVSGTVVKQVLDTFAANDAGTVYRLIAGRDNTAVILGNISVSPTPLSGAELIANATVDFWGA